MELGDTELKILVSIFRDTAKGLYIAAFAIPSFIAGEQFVVFTRIFAVAILCTITALKLAQKISQ